VCVCDSEQKKNTLSMSTNLHTPTHSHTHNTPVVHVVRPKEPDEVHPFSDIVIAFTGSGHLVEELIHFGVTAVEGLEWPRADLVQPIVLSVCV
jgi:hypothetical protein